MEHKTWETMTEDKIEWGDGPWMNEPDKEQWCDPATGLPCLLKRNMFGSLCGYVGVSEGHPWFGVHRNDIDDEISVHGGLTYSDFCEEGDEAHTICHVTEPGEPDRLWWLGFDCGHAWDIQPGLMIYSRSTPALEELMDHLLESGATYKPVGYVKRQCAELAAQVRQVAGGWA
jgi:hypothetical protein